MAIKFSDIFNSNDININNAKLEEVLNKTKDMAEIVGKKSAEHLEISKKKFECIDAKAKLSKLFEKYGELQYNICVGEDVDLDELDSMVLRITELKEKISALNIEIETAKAQFNEAVSTATKKTRDAFQKEFDKMNKSDVPEEDQLDVSEFFEEDE